MPIATHAFAVASLTAPAPPNSSRAWGLASPSAGLVFLCLLHLTTEYLKGALKMLSKSDWPTDYRERFWDAYPRKVAKKYALSILDRVKKSGEVPFEILISAVQLYARSMVGREMQYVKHPSTWLAQGCWDDAPEAIVHGAKFQAPALPMANGKVLIRRGTPQAWAWARYRGRDFPWGPSGVWMVETEWPPK